MLSICIPAYTYVDYTAEAARSILMQDVDVELVVVEDFDLLPPNHSERSRIGEVRELLNSDPRVQWISANTRRSIQKNWNFTVSQATRKNVKVMGADDRLRPAGIKALLTFLKSEPDIQFLGHLGTIIDDQGQVVRRMSPYVANRETVYINPDESVRLKLQQIARFREPACNVFTKNVWDQVGGYSEQFRFCFDVHFNTRVMASVRSALISEEWCELRRHQGSDGAKLPADLALDELEQLVKFSLGLIKGGATAQDRHHGEAMMAYRVIELALARCDGSVSQALHFICKHRARISLSPTVLSKVVQTLYRRLRKGDVQKTVATPKALHRLK
ncbi:Glycosyl transferase family 2 [Sphaerotilus natans]|nr:glycosyltransferase [Sphaerotilus natans]SIR55212.1 Glycosyl transferase family 2 [Sphaerotilus natans]